MASNEALLILRQNIIRIYKQYEMAVFPILKFIIIFSTIMMISAQTGYSGTLAKPMIVIFLSLIGIFLPDKWLVLGAVFLATVHALALNLLFGGVVFVFLWVLYLVFMRLFPKESLLIVATILSLNMGIGYLVPILAALFGGFVCIIPIILGIFISQVTPQLLLIFTTAGENKAKITDLAGTLQALLSEELFLNKTMLCIIVIFFIVFSIVYIIRKQSTDFAPYIAIAVGAVFNLAGFGIAILFLSIEVNMLLVFIMTLMSALVAVIAQFFSIVLDYSRAEVVQFEDEENYYHVKVIPKINIMSYNNKVKHIYYNGKNKNDYY